MKFNIKLSILILLPIFAIIGCEENFLDQNCTFNNKHTIDSKKFSKPAKNFAQQPQKKLIKTPKDLPQITPNNSLLNYFYEISRIPHCSGNKKQIANYIIKKAKENNLSFKQDNIGNIIIYKKAYAGLEKVPTLILQAHMDMVCTKKPMSNHDFTKDPLTLAIKDNYIYAKNTTLGADNGIGVAAILAIMANKNLKHGPLELILTVDEELGSKGTKAMAKDFFKGKYLINLDSFNSEEITIGSANSVNITGQLSLEFVCRSSNDLAYAITITGLTGGHSGQDIDKNRANAIKILAYLTAKLTKYQSRIISLKAGNFANVIPAHAELIINIPRKNSQQAIRSIKELFQSLKKDIFVNEPNMTLEIKITKNATCMLSNQSHNQVLNLLLAMPHGPMTKVAHIDYIPYTSTNLAIAKIIGQNLLIVIKPRSLSYSGLYTIVKSIIAVLNLAGAKIYYENYSPSWGPKKNSQLLFQAKNTYKKLFGAEPKLKFLHAVLESANFAKKRPDLDIISYGPHIIGAHSVLEKVEIPSIEKFWLFITTLIKDLTETKLA